MRRETKILLAMLATLAGVFVGVLSMKLLVPRPPAGAGPDVHIDVANVAANELVSPPDLSAPPADVAARESPRAASAGFALSPGARSDGDADSMPAGEFAPRRDPFVTAASLEQPLQQPEQPPASRTTFPASPTDVAPTATTMPPDAAIIQPAPRSFPAAASPQPAAPPPPSSTYVAAAGDSWWDLAERTYGDGRLYRALFAWNRAVDARISLAPGTRLEIPPRERLEAAWPKLVPRPGSATE